MKVLGAKQFKQMKFKYMPLDGSRFQGILGKVPMNFVGVIYGYSGNGKTEFGLQLCTEFIKHDKVVWLSYEQRHDSDLQEASNRNGLLDDGNGLFLIADPLKGKPADQSNFEHLCNYLKKRSTPRFIFIDSLDYLNLSVSEYFHIKENFGKKKVIIFLSHSTKTGKLRKKISEDVIFDGGLGIWVSNYIAYPEKNRYGGFEPHVIYEKMAREKNPDFFAKPKGNKKKRSAQTSLFDSKKQEGTGGNDTQIPDLARGVQAEKHTKEGGIS